MIRLLWMGEGEPAWAQCVRSAFNAPEIQITRLASLAELLLHVRNSLADVVVLSFRTLSEQSDDRILELLRVDQDLPVIVDCLRATTEDVIRLVRLGIFHVWVETPRPERVRTCIESAAGRRKITPDAAGPTVNWRNSAIGSSPEMQRVFEIVHLVAARRATVLITGETGTGKEVIARAIHVAGGRGHLPLVAVNCGAIPENLVESELFGYAKGAFTGAIQSRAGKFEQADGGTIFLDEVGELPLEAQAKLLRVLQEREIQRIGCAETVRLNVRVIAATNTNLAEAVRRKEFREDLYYRLNVIPLHLPALRGRAGDIPQLVQHFLTKVCESENLPMRSISPEVVGRLARLKWPGNVRQLEHVIEMAVILSGSRTILDECDFPILNENCPDQTAVSAHSTPGLPPDGMDLDEAVRRFERSMVQQALLRCRGNKARAAQMLRMKRTTLLDRLKSLDAYNGLEMQEVCA